MRRLLAVAGFCLAATLFAVPAALAATPQQIYRDYATHGRLTGHYSKADLERASRSLIVQGYKPTTQKGMKQAAKHQSSQNNNNQGNVKGATTTAPAVKSSSSGLPFTGVDLALISIAAVFLLAFGASLRRFARRTN